MNQLCPLKEQCVTRLRTGRLELASNPKHIKFSDLDYYGMKLTVSSHSLRMVVDSDLSINLSFSKSSEGIECKRDAQMSIPNPVPVFRLMHVDNVDGCLRRGGMYAPHHIPEDGINYRTIHNIDIQNQRSVCTIPCGVRGTIHDYVSFYFGPRSPMLFQLHTGWVPSYDEGQEPLVYAVSTVDAIVEAGLDFVFSDGHGIAAFSQWYEDIADLDKVDWAAVYVTYWNDTLEDPDRQRRKQAEFLIHVFCPWDVVQEISVLNEAMRQRVTGIIGQHSISTPVRIRQEWYY